MTDSNIGETGVGSIRIKGQKIENLPLGQGNDAKVGLLDAQTTERLNKINEINAKYPTQRIDYLRGRINECKVNIERIQSTKDEQLKMISDYEGYISLAKHRDKMLDQTTDRKKRRELFDQFGRFQVEPMQQQIAQCKEAIDRCDVVIQTENGSITEFSEVLALCKQRDKELARYNAKAEGSHRE